MAAYGIIGGGMLGLTLAWRLRQRGHEVTIFESSPEIGGLAGVWKIGPVTWDRHYHVLLLSDTHLRRLLAELGLESDCIWRRTKTGFYTEGQIHSMSNSWEFLRFPPLRLIDKLRLAATILRASRLRDPRPLENIPVVDWLRRWSGTRTLEKIWLPLLRAKLGESYQDTSAAFIWATISRMYAARRSGLKEEMFGYVRGGYARILESFAELLRKAGVTIQTNSPVQRVGQGTVELADGSNRCFDRIVVTTPAPTASLMCPELTSGEHSLLRNVRYQGIVCASILLRRPLSPYYVTNITEPWVPFTGIIEMTALVDPNDFGGHSLIYLPKYVPPEDSVFDESDDVILERFLRALERIYADFRRVDLVACRVSKVRRVFALTTLGYSDRIPPMTTSVPGLFLVNSSHIVYGTLNVNETVQLAERALPVIDPQHSTSA